jgi:hypothetical protein
VFTREGKEGEWSRGVHVGAEDGVRASVGLEAAGSGTPPARAAAGQEQRRCRA